jgi:uncharacterized membrane protein YccF (DUF307 family)
VWLVLFGWEFFLVHLLAGAVLCITIIGIPFGIQAFKMSVLALWPFGRRVEELDALGGPPTAPPASTAPTGPTASTA